MSENTRTDSDKFRIRRFANKITQRAVSARSGVNITYLNRWERGVLLLPDEIIRKLESALNDLIVERVA